MLKPNTDKMLLWGIMFLLAAGCDSTASDPCKYEHPEWLYGRWKVFHINKGGMKIGGQGFRGTDFTFRENGTVHTESPEGDTNTVKFQYLCDTLIYFTPAGNEFYSIDSLTEHRLRLGYVSEGIPSIVDFLKVQ
jgi:hypothetical protein